VGAGGELPKRRIPHGGPSENNGGSILHGPSHVGKLVHLWGWYTLWGLTPKCNEPKLL
jgi:hypothetical protein